MGAPRTELPPAPDRVRACRPAFDAVVARAMADGPTPATRPPATSAAPPSQAAAAAPRRPSRERVVARGAAGPLPPSRASPPGPHPARRSRAPRPPGRRRRRRLAALVAAGVVALAAVGGAVALSGGDDEAPTPKPTPAAATPAADARGRCDPRSAAEQHRGRRRHCVRHELPQPTHRRGSSTSGPARRAPARAWRRRPQRRRRARRRVGRGRPLEGAVQAPPAHRSGGRAARLASSPQSVAVGHGAVWVGLSTLEPEVADTLVRIDARTLRVTREYPSPRASAPWSPHLRASGSSTATTPPSRASTSPSSG